MVGDHGYNGQMQEFSVSRFKATCLSIIERVRQTGEPVLITKHGQPVAQLVPSPSTVQEGASGFGCMQGTAEQVGDILEPLSEEELEVLR